MPTLPRRIECCDISHLGGDDTVGAVVAMPDGVPDKKRYRTFNVRGVARREDDDGRRRRAETRPAGQRRDARSRSPAMTTARCTRCSRVASAAGSRRKRSAPPPGADGELGGSDADELERDRGEWDLPDLFVVDGGRGSSPSRSPPRATSASTSSPSWRSRRRRRTCSARRSSIACTSPAEEPDPAEEPLGVDFFLARAATRRTASRTARASAWARRGASGPRSTTSRASARRRGRRCSRHLGSLKAIEAATDDALLAAPGVTARHLKALRVVYPEGRNPPVGSAQSATSLGRRYGRPARRASEAITWGGGRGGFLETPFLSWGSPHPGLVARSLRMPGGPAGGSPRPR